MSRVILIILIIVFCGGFYGVPVMAQAPDEYLSDSGRWNTRIGAIKLRGVFIVFPPPR